MSSASVVPLAGARSDRLVTCPQPGKWAISVWAGVDGQGIEAALDTCGSGTIAAAYWLDPKSQQWLRYFRGRPEISNLTELGGMQAIITLGSFAA